MSLPALYKAMNIFRAANYVNDYSSPLMEEALIFELPILCFYYDGIKISEEMLNNFGGVSISLRARIGRNQ